MKHRDVLHDPVFHDLLHQHAKAARRLRDSVLALRAWHLDHVKHPGEETTSEKWRSATLQEDAVRSLEMVKTAAEELLRYGFEMAPHSGETEHITSIRAARSAHRERLKRFSLGKYGSQEASTGPEEKIYVDDGPPLTIVLKPKPPE